MQPKAFERAAQALAGKAVDVRLRPPCLIGADGLALVDKQTGRRVIDLDPELSPARLLSVFAHETAHHALNHPAPGGFVDMPPRSISPRVTAAVGAMKDREDPADHLAADWLAQAEIHAAVISGDWLSSRLAALADLPARRAVSAGVKLALSRLPKR